MARRRPLATGRNPFGSQTEPRILITVVDDILLGTHWAPPEPLPPLVNWAAFLSDTVPDMSLVAGALDQMAADTDLSTLSLLVGVAANFFRSLRSFQDAPTVQEGFARIHEMRNAAKLLAGLAKGDQANTSPPSVDAFHVQLGQRSKGLHAFLHDLLQDVDAPTPRMRDDGTGWEAHEPGQVRRDRRLRLFFDLIEEVVDRLTISDKVVAEMQSRDPRSRQKGVPRDLAYDWLLVRLMWIWRDALGRDLAIYLPRIGKRGSHPEPKAPDGSLIEFICDVLKHLEPVAPHELSALEKKLIELRGRTPEGNLFTT